MYKTRISDPTQRYNESAKKLNILIVDDDEDCRQSLMELIKMRGHNVTVLDEGMKCINRCSETNYDIIFMDYHMDRLCDDEELCGADVTTLLTECFDTDCMIFGYTGDNTDQTIQKCKENNMKGVFIKPISPNLLDQFFRIVERDKNDQLKLSKLMMTNKNFIYFRKKKQTNMVSSACI